MLGRLDFAESFPIYTDSSNVSSCDSYGTSGSSVCDDVILIPFTPPIRVWRLIIYAPQSEIILCEVQVFGGKFLFCHNMNSNHYFEKSRQ